MKSWNVIGIIVFCGLLSALGSAGAFADAVKPAALEGVGIDQRLGSSVPTDLVFHDEQGHDVRLGSLLEGKPAVLSLVYYQCPMLCTVVLSETLRSLQAIPLTMHEQYNVITISFDPAETAALAAAKKKSYASAYGRPGAQQGWHFLTGDADTIRRLTDAVGFRYRYDQLSRQYIHPSGLMILAPDGRITRYFFGIDYDPFDLRMALLDASQGRVGSPTDKILLYCYHYDPSTGRYGLEIFRLLKLGGILTVLMLGSTIGLLVVKDRRRSRTLLIHGATPHPREGSP